MSGPQAERMTKAMLTKHTSLVGTYTERTMSPGYSQLLERTYM